MSAVATLTLADAALMMREKRPARTWIYFIQAGTDGPIKIGVTRNPRRRLASLQQANAELLSVLGLYRCCDPQGQVSASDPLLLDRRRNGEAASALLTLGGEGAA